MSHRKIKLLSTAVAPALALVGMTAATSPAAAEPGYKGGCGYTATAGLPAAKARTGSILLAASCSPCAAKNPCNPCAPANPCNPCAAKNPCAAANPCNPCAAANPCNPCAPKNPCAAANPCAPCSPCNPCNPCGAAAAVEITADEAAAVYDCLRTEMAAAYSKAGLESGAAYPRWTNVATAPYQSATHGSRYVNNYANAIGAVQYSHYEDVGTMPAGSVLAKDSFVVNANGTVSVGPLFLMEKMRSGFSAQSHDWRYTLVMPNGAIVGTTGGRGSSNVNFCIECHAAVADDQDSLFLLPDEFRVKFR